MQRSRAREKRGIRFDVPVAHFSEFRDGLIVRHVEVSNTGAIVEAIQGRAAGAGR